MDNPFDAFDEQQSNPFDAFDGHVQTLNATEPKIKVGPVNVPEIRLPGPVMPQAPQQDAHPLLHAVLQGINPLNWPDIVMRSPRTIMTAPGTVEEGITGQPSKVFPGSNFNFPSLVPNLFKNEYPGWTPEQIQHFESLPKEVQDEFWQHTQSQRGGEDAQFQLMSKGLAGGVRPLERPGAPSPALNAFYDYLHAVGQPINEAATAATSLENLPFLLTGGSPQAARLVAGLLAGSMATKAPESIEQRFQKAKQLGGVPAYLEAGVGSAVDAAMPMLVAKGGSMVKDVNPFDVFDIQAKDVEGRRNIGDIMPEVGQSGIPTPHEVSDTYVPVEKQLPFSPSPKFYGGRDAPLLTAEQSNEMTSGERKALEPKKLSDVEQYNALLEKQKAMHKAGDFIVGDKFTPEYLNVWKQMEEIKNRQKDKGYLPEGAKEQPVEVASDKGTKMYTGAPLGEIKDLFTEKARMLLRDPEKLRFAPSRQGDYDGGQLVRRLLNSVPPAEQKVLESQGIKEAFKDGERTTLEKVDKWVEENGPKVEVRKFGESARAPEIQEYNKLTHEWFDSLQPKQKQDYYQFNAIHENDLSKLSNWRQVDIDKAIRYKELALNDVVIKGDRGNTAHWQSIAPKEESKMPGYVEIAVVKPTKKLTKNPEAPEYIYRGGKEYTDPESVQFPSSHNFPPNTLGFVRGYMETLPDGKKVFHVIEVQSDWAQRVREFSKEGNSSSSLQESGAMTEPLLPHYERLALKAAIDHARSEGADAIAVSDAETAMMTEGHDRNVGHEQFDRLEDIVGHPNFGNTRPPERLAELRKLPLIQEPGMRLHYDRTLQKIASELTGQKGEKVSFGEHKMAMDQISDNTGGLVRHGPRKDLIFRNEAGEPKTDVSAISYPLENVGNPPYSKFGSKLYSGFSIFDPELWGKAKETIKSEKDKLASVLASKGDKLAADATKNSATRQFVSKEERAKVILSNPNAVRLDKPKEVMAQPGETLSAKDSALNSVRRAASLAAEGDKIVNPWDAIYDWMDGGKAEYNGPLMENIRKPLDSDFNDELNLRGQMLEPIRQAIVEGKMGKKESSRIGVYLNTLQEGGIERMTRSGIDPKVIEKIVKTITPNEKKVAESIRQMYDKTFPLIQKVAKEVDGIDVKPIPNYFSWQRDWRKYQPEADELAKSKSIPANATVDDVLWPGMPEEGAPRKTPGSLLKRQPRSTSPIKTDAFEIVDRYVRDSAHYISMRKHLKEISSIVKQPEFAQKYGQMGQDLIMEHLNTMARQGRYKANVFIDTLRRLTSRGVIAFRIPSQLVHLANVPLAMGRTGVPWWKAGLDASMSEEGQVFLKKYFAETFERGGGEPALREVAEGKLGRTPGMQKVSNAGFWVQRQIDQLNAQATVMGLYMRRLKESGKDPTEFASLPIDGKAIQDARVLARRAVASPLYKDVPPVVTRGGSITRSLLQFQNTFLDQWSNLRYDLIQAGIPKAIVGNPKLALQMTVALGAMLMVESAVKFGYKKALNKVTGNKERDDETFQATLAHEALRRIPGMGQLQAMLVYGETGVPSVDVAMQPIRETMKAVNATSSAGRTMAATKVGVGLGEALGVPGASQIGDVALGVERHQFFKPHEQRLKEETGKDVIAMPLRERILAERKFRQDKPKISAEESANSAERSIANITKRGTEILKGLDKGQRQWVESRGLTVPGFDNKLKFSGETVYLTDEETDRLTKYVKEEYVKAIDKIKVKAQFDHLKQDQRDSVFSEALTSARAVARGRLIKEIKNGRVQ